MHSRTYPLAFLTLILAFGVVIYEKVHEAQTTLDQHTQLAAIIDAYVGTSTTLDLPTKSSGCVVEGPLPDHSCTPGDVFPAATASTICVPGYSKSVRNVPVSLKRELYEAYGFSYPQATGAFELDHLIPLELGGSNDRANLFPEAAVPPPGFHEKDIVENYLHEQVCAGTVPLAAAQKQIATNWIAVYQSLSPEIIAALKKEFRSWATATPGNTAQ